MKKLENHSKPFSYVFNIKRKEEITNKNKKLNERKYYKNSKRLFVP
jgi:hypothetical protein